MRKILSKSIVQKYFLVGVLNLSLISLFFCFFGFTYPSLITSIIGVLGSVLLLLNYQWASYLILIWSFSQLIIISNIWDATQLYSFNLSLHIKSKTDFYSIGLNLLGLVYVILAKLILKRKIVGSNITLVAFKQDSFMAGFLPAEFSIIELISFGKNEDWYLIEGKEFSPPKFALIKPKNKEFLNTNKSGQLLWYRGVESLEYIYNREGLKKFSNIGFVRVKKK
jgi:hypothetical protein